MNLTKYFAEKMSHFDHKNDSSEVLCSVCQAPLTDLISMSAGMGPVCRAKSCFAEQQSREDLALLEGSAEIIEDNNYPFGTFPTRIAGEKTPRLMTFIANKANEVWAFDRTEYNKIYQSDDSISVADSILNSFYQINKNQIESIAHLESPEKTTLKEKFKEFQEKNIEEVKPRETVMETNYPSVKDRKVLDKGQTKDRNSLIKNIRSETDEHINDWADGKFTMETLMARLANSKLAGAQELLAVLQSQYSNITPKDHGLTDDEIRHGLAQGVKLSEKKIFNSLIKGSNKLLEISQVYKTLKENDGPVDQKIRQKFNDLTS